MNSQDKNWLLEEKYNGVQNVAFLRDCERIAAGEPLDYVIGFSQFLGCHIDLSERPLIPRPETEFWVEQLIGGSLKLSFKLETKFQGKGEFRVLDIFAGSGCIGVALLKHLPDVHVDFVDIDPTCIRQIEKNCALNDIAQKRFRIIQSDMFSALEGENYEMIVANPPYIASPHDFSRVGQSVLEHEPHEALFSGEDGFEHIRAFLREAPKHLAPGGLIAMEFDDIQKDDIEKFATEHLDGMVTFHRDQYGCYRWLTYVHE